MTVPAPVPTHVWSEQITPTWREKTHRFIASNTQLKTGFVCVDENYLFIVKESTIKNNRQRCKQHQGMLCQTAKRAKSRLRE